MTDTRAALAAVFLADGPRPELAERLAPFAPLIGSWSLVVTEYEPDGGSVEHGAEWHFGWALNGRALADVWISPPRADRSPGDPGEWGLSLRFWDESLGAFRSTWHGPGRGWVIPFVARPTADGGLELRGQRDGTALRWVFSDVTATSFAWRAEETPPGGRAWVRQRFAATRTA
jgi:hypothetical protein